MDKSKSINPNIFWRSAAKSVSAANWGFIFLAATIWAFAMMSSCGSAANCNPKQPTYGDLPPAPVTDSLLPEKKVKSKAELIGEIVDSGLRLEAEEGRFYLFVNPHTETVYIFEWRKPFENKPWRFHLIEMFSREAYQRGNTDLDILFPNTVLRANPMDIK